jgi:hypothetical protein
MLFAAVDISSISPTPNQDLNQAVTTGRLLTAWSNVRTLVPSTQLRSA